MNNIDVPETRLEAFGRLKNFLDNSPVNFYAVDTARNLLEDAGYVMLEQKDRWELVPGGKYFIMQNQSAIFAFVVGCAQPSVGFKIISAHSDSPGFRIKPHPAINTPGNMVKLNTEVYGGPILYTWFDRPLSVAGRVVLKGDDPLHPVTRLMKVDRPVMTIPHLAIHFNRQVNEGNPLSKQNDMLPVVGRIKSEAERENLIPNLIRDTLDVYPSDILDFDLSLFDTTPACMVGLNDDFITSGRLDDLSMVEAGLEALLDCGENPLMTNVLAIFDNEETGSGTKQGAASPVLDYLLRRIVCCLGGSEEDFFRSVANSFMVSADNAHGVHPNYVSKQDPTNHPVLGDGPAIKVNANCKYMSDADSAAVFRTICENAGVKYQYFVNHSDVAGGSTLGNILTSKIPLRGVDMGAPLWAMHSVRETAAIDDHIATVKAFKEFYNC